MGWIKLDDGIGDDPKIMQVSPLAELLYIHGLCYANAKQTDGRLLKRVAKNKLLDVEKVEDLIAELVGAGLWLEVKGGYEIHAYLAHQRSKKQIEAMSKKRSVAGRNGGKQNRKQTLSKTEANVKQTVKQNGSKTGSKNEAEEEEEKELLTTTKAVVNTRPEVSELCERLAAKIKARDPKAKADGTSTTWLEECRKLIDLDGRTVEEIAIVIDWSQADSFWHKNILSMPKLRKKFDQLWAAANAPAGKSGDDDDGWAGFQEWAKDDTSPFETTGTHQMLHQATCEVTND